MDAFVLPSRWEGLSLALVEALGAGLPTVATAVGGNPEVICEGRTGLLVPPNEPPALADALEALLRDRPSARELGAAASRDVRARFSIEQHVAEIAGLYRQGLETQGLRPTASPTEIGR
jgi:glycosyltransferase involved in cell wall biosynthesis